MKKLCVLALCLMSSTVFAAKVLPIHLLKGMKANPTPLVLAKAKSAQMSCNLYSIYTDDNDNDTVTLLASQQSQSINVGTPTDMAVQFPAPYNKVGVQFSHTTVSYLETGFQNMTPYLQAFFTDDKGMSDYKDVNFSLDSVRSGSSILLRGVYGFDESTSLFYQCSMTFLK